MKDGGYDDGYRLCPCFWGTQPGSLLGRLLRQIPQFDGLTVLDAGCGEGKNAAFLANRGAAVRAFDLSVLALEHARHNWPSSLNVQWEIGDVRDIALPVEGYDVVICYGLLHCLRSEEEVRQATTRLMNATRSGGTHVICTFNSRYQELIAHPNFAPLLLSHATYLSLYTDWRIEYVSDEDLHETHPHNNIPHIHSMTRIIAQKESR